MPICVRYDVVAATKATPLNAIIKKYGKIKRFKLGHSAQLPLNQMIFTALVAKISLLRQDGRSVFHLPLDLFALF